MNNWTLGLGLTSYMLLVRSKTLPTGNFLRNQADFPCGLLSLLGMLKIGCVILKDSDWPFSSIW